MRVRNGSNVAVQRELQQVQIGNMVKSAEQLVSAKSTHREQSVVHEGPVDGPSRLTTLDKFEVRRKGFGMNADKIQRWINAVIVVLALSILGAVIWEVLSSGSKTARIIGYVAFGIIYIFLRAVPPRFLIPKPKK
jgi:hypothetical protein